ncbi:MAG: DDE-type integrase/transposase/recombinase [Methanosarcinaceae archaeon]|nr:DDE-type integrase/transposase/recombinase [Methanosarcinaceae archaeon]
MGAYSVNRVHIINKRFEWTCTCPDHRFRNVVCKHIFAVQLSLKLRAEVEENVKLSDIPRKPVTIEVPQTVITAKSDITCPVCHCIEVIKSGLRKTTFGQTQRFECKNCGHRFIEDAGFINMKTDPKLITLTLDLYFKGISYRKITDHLKQFHDLEVIQTTPMRWVKKYLKLLSTYAEKHKADVGNIWHSDETTVFIKKENEKRYYEWIWNVMDADTRYLLACQVTKERYVEDAQKPLRQAKKNANKRPDAIVTDGLQAYKKAIRNEFMERSAPIPNPHVRLKDFETKPNNNILERLNGTFRERTKVMRSFSGQIGASDFAAGMQVYYNYIRPHQGIDGLTPAQMANIPIDFEGNRWKTMIELATKG